MIITNSNQQTVILQPGQVLTVAASALSLALVYRLASSVGGQPGAPTEVAASVSTTFGPYPDTVSFLIVCSYGTVTVTAAVVDLTALPLGQSASFVITPTNLTCSNGLSIIPLDTAITADTTLTSAPAGSIGFTSHATGRGKLFSSDGVKWQYVVVA